MVPIVKLSQLAQADALNGTEAVPLVQGGVTKRTTAANLIPIPVQKFVFDTDVTTPPDFGEMAWNQEDATVDIGLTGGVVLQVGQETLIKVKASATIGNGQLIKLTGADGNSGRLRGAPANGSLPLDGFALLGVATQDIANNQIGFVTSEGVVRGINTTGSAVAEVWEAGDVLYPHPTIPGGLTKGTPTVNIPIAVVLFAGANGSLFVRR
jgi:hypothetical protein